MNSITYLNVMLASATQVGQAPAIHKCHQNKYKPKIFTIQIIVCIITILHFKTFNHNREVCHVASI